MPTDVRSFDEIKLPFNFVPHGAPEPKEWLVRHPDNIKLPATFEPHARGAGRPGPARRPAGRRPGTPWAGARRSVDGLAVAPGPGAPSSPTGSVMSDAMSAATDASYRRTFTSYSPITAFLRADAGLATAANNYAPGGANGSNLAAYAQNDPWNRADPLGLPSDQTQTAASQSSQNHGTSWQGVAVQLPNGQNVPDPGLQQESLCHPLPT